MRTTLRRLAASIALAFVMLVGAAQQAAAREEIYIFLCELVDVEFVQGFDEPILTWECELIYYEYIE